MTKRSKTGFTITTRISETPMTEAQWEAAEDLLAEMVAEMIFKEYRERFGGETNDKNGPTE